MKLTILFLVAVFAVIICEVNSERSVFTDKDGVHGGRGKGGGGGGGSGSGRRGKRGKGNNGQGGKSGNAEGRGGAGGEASVTHQSKTKVDGPKGGLVDAGGESDEEATIKLLDPQEIMHHRKRYLYYLADKK